ncbi:MAG: outer membrane protein assembly factor BamD [Chromatiales bacterium]|nr:MAG: outer membrane protein assembly factor BamD [Chromatiales bacterium]
MDSPSTTLSARILVAGLALALGGCFFGKGDEDLKSGADQLYEYGTRSMNNGNYANAVQYFEALEARYPFSNKAKQAQLDLLYTYYRNGDRDQVIDASIQFERENPTHPRVDYALYMRGLAQFSSQHNRLHKLLRVDLAKRPPVEARESFSAFAQLVKRYPNSIYAPDARQRMIFLRNRLAAHEIYVADYYMRRGAWAAALNRARYVVETYDGSPSVAQALDIMAQAYGKLGMQDVSIATREVLAQNYPDSRFKQYGEARARWWWLF